MKPTLHVICIVLALLCCSIGRPSTRPNADTIGVNTLDTFASLPNLVGSNCFAFFDIDETLMMPKTQFIYGIDKSDDFIEKLSTTLSPELYSKITQTMEDTYYKMPSVLVEDDVTLSALVALYRKKCNLFAITARHHDSTVPVLLKSLGVDFSTLQHNISIDPYTTSQVSYEAGILYLNNTSKGDALIDFMAKRIPDHYRVTAITRLREVIFVDNTMKHCVDVLAKFGDYSEQEATFSATGIATYHYTAARNRISDTGMLYQFPQILADALK